MLSATALRSVIAVGFLALPVAGCSVALTRFEDNSFWESAPPPLSESERLSRLARAAPDPGMGSIFRPKLDLANVGRLAEVRSGNHSAVHRAARPAHRIERLTPHQKPSGEVARTKNDLARNIAMLGHPSSQGLHPQRALNSVKSNSSHGPPKGPVQKIVTRGSVADAAGGARAIFQWPASGKIVARFGAQRDGDKSHGITIAIPEDTPIRCAGNGVVIYAGSSLKTFGNLVLVRHADNYVTAYAHAKALKVKRGDRVKRGDVLGTSGRTGEVSTPRLYFEIRKDSAPVDPLRLLTTGPDVKRATSSMWPRVAAQETGVPT